MILGFTEDFRALEAINFAHCCYECDTNITSENLAKLGYLPPIQFMRIQSKTPDLTLFKESDGDKELFALIMEVKSGRVQEQHLIEQAKPYSSFKLFDVNEVFKKEAKRNPKLEKYRNWTVSRFSVIFQYYESFLTSLTEVERVTLEEMRKRVHVASCSRGETVKSAGGIQIKDAETMDLYSRGIRIPADPPFIVRMGESPSLEYVAFCVCQQAITDTCRDDNPVFTPEQTKNDHFSKYNVSIGTLEIILTKLNQMGVCTKKKMDVAVSRYQQEYVFFDPLRTLEIAIRSIQQDKNLDEIIGEQKRPK
jgi:hypothetical protein